MSSQFSIKLDPTNFGSGRSCNDMAYETSTNNALGTLIGYIGAEAATHEIFERLLWPQRFYHGFGIHNALRMALTLPMGAPLHKAAFATLDQIRIKGLFKGHAQGHMLGSPFYQDTRLQYSSHDEARPHNPDKEWVRNGLWTRVLENLPNPQIASLVGSRSVETELRESGRDSFQRIRSVNRVSHLKLSVSQHTPQSNEIIGNETCHTTCKTYLAIIVSEITAIITGTVVFAVWRSAFMLLWFIPLILRILSAYFAVPRSPLELPSSPCPGNTSPTTNETSPLDEKLLKTYHSVKKFEIHDLLHGFLIIEGNEELILQFFRHYGHPIRHRFRECAQIFIVVAFGLLFPIGLICSIVWMPLGIQYAWLGYQLYTTIAMYVYLFMDGHALGTTEQSIAQQFQKQAIKGEKQRVYFGGPTAIIAAELEVTYHSRVSEGKAHMEKLLYGDRPDIQRASESATSCGSPTSCMGPSDSSSSLPSRSSNSAS